MYLAISLKGAENGGFVLIKGDVCEINRKGFTICG